MIDSSSLLFRLKGFFTEKNLLVIFFIGIALLFGVLTIVITPPLQGPDEDIHFAACWKITHGDFTRTVSKSMADFSWAHGYLVSHPEKKYSLEKWCSALKYKADSTKVEKMYACNSITFYAAPSYIPPLIGVFISSVFSDRYLPALYMGRLCCLLVYVFLGALALYFLPTGKTAIFLLLLMPQSIFQASVISYDGITNSAMCLWATLLCRDIFVKGTGEQEFSKELFLSSILLCFCKVPYMIVLGALILLFAVKELQGKKRILPVIFSSFLFLAFLIPLKNILSTLALPDNLEKFVRIMEAGKGTVDILQDNSLSVSEILLQFPQLLLATLTDITKLQIYVGSFIGCLGGGLDTLLPPSLLIIYLLLIVFSCFNTENKISCNCRLFFLVCGLGLIGMIFLIFTIDYQPSNGTISGITGRYFIPASFFLALAAGGNILRCKWYEVYKELLAVTGVVLLGIVMIVTLLQRYYFEYWWDRTI